MTKTILIIDDDQDDLDIFCEAVKAAKLDINCITGLGAIDGLIILENLIVLPDYIFLDLNMPVMNGIECLREIRNRYKTIPVIIFSTSTSMKDKLDVILDETTKYVVKPALFTHYQHVIKNAIDLV